MKSVVSRQKVLKRVKKSLFRESLNFFSKLVTKIAKNKKFAPVTAQFQTFNTATSADNADS